MTILLCVYNFIHMLSCRIISFNHYINQDTGPLKWTIKIKINTNFVSSPIFVFVVCR